MTVQVSDSDLAWARERLAEHLPSARIEGVHSVTSRLARLHRITVIGEGGRRTRYYLKRCEAERLDRWPEQMTHLAAVANAIDGTDGLLRFRMVAADAAQGLLLTAEVPGRPLSSLHRPSIVRRSARRAAWEGWRGAGRWLGRLHTDAMPPSPSTSRAPEMAQDVSALLGRLGAEDPSQAALAAEAVRAATDVLRMLDGRPVPVGLCHGDVTAGNIIVHGAAVGLVDLDDLRMDMPGLDWSQALLAMDEFGHVGWSGPGVGIAEWSAAFAEGYRRPRPIGPEFWLPHLRNLAVYLVTLSRQLRGVSLGRLAVEFRYRRLLRELWTTINAVAHAPSSGRPGS